jgi:hypothetical protein
MDGFWDDLLRSWWGKIVIAALCRAIACAIVVFFRRYEAAHDPMVGPWLVWADAPWYVVAVYYIGGKWVAAAPFGAIGLLLGVAGIRQFRRGEDE